MAGNKVRGRFFLQLNAVPKDRPRLGRFGVYTPKKTSVFERDIVLLVKSRLRHQPLEKCAIAVRIKFYITRDSKPAIKRIYPHVKPDLDNYAKAVLDALEGILWKNDSQIVLLSLCKQYCTRSGILISYRQL